MRSIIISTTPGETYNILDGDMYVRKVAHAAKEDTNFTHVLHSIKMMLKDSREAVPAQHERIYITSNDKSNFRYTVAKTPVIKKCAKDFVLDGKQIIKGEMYQLLGYKKHRANSEKPKYYQRLRDYLVEYHNAMIVEGIETDDMLGIQATKPGRISTIHTFDKDLLMQELDVYDPTTKVLHTYDKHWQLEMRGKKLYGRGRAWFYAQMLLGDGVDNIPGIPLYGPVHAFKALQDCNTELDYVVATWAIYLEHVGDADRAKERYLEIMKLLWMQTDSLRDIEAYILKYYGHILT